MGLKRISGKNNRKDLKHNRLTPIERSTLPSLLFQYHGWWVYRCCDHSWGDVSVLYMLMGGRWGTRGACFGNSPSEKSWCREHLFCASGMSELEFSRIIGMVLMEQVHSLKESCTCSSSKDYEDSTTHLICELSLSLTTVSIWSGC